jgi:predicted phage baseplate assembly protein
LSLPTPNLDDLRFQQDLVDEARRRIVQYCPEWTDYNLSDPGITLIELFAWMTEQMLYRLNRVPEKNYIKFMELLGITLQSASSAQTELTFRLSVPFPLDDERDITPFVPENTEVATRPVDGEEEVIFSTDQRLVVLPPNLLQLRRGVDFARNYLPRLNVQECRVFRDDHPQEGDTFYLGFSEDTSIAGYILRLDLTCREALATGIKRTDPPLVWECSMGNGEWLELAPSTRPGETDSTGGLNNPEGRIVFYLPLSMRPDEYQGISAYWIRCRFQQKRPAQGRYTQSPRLLSIKPFVLGATVSATHAVLIQNEELGICEGVPGQRFQLNSYPLLEPAEDEVLEIEERIKGEIVYVPWERVKEFSLSTRHDRHYVLNTSTGEIQLGPTIRQRDGSTMQYGRVPEGGRRVRFMRYRAGGGTRGNLPVGRLNSLRTTIPYIDSVTNMRRAEGGQDFETLEEAKIRTPQELRSTGSAVTAKDFEDLARRANRKVARTKALTAGMGEASPPPGMIVILVVPAAFNSLREGDLTNLELSEALSRNVEEFLDEYRLLTSTLLVREPSYTGVRVHASVVAEQHFPADVVRSQVLEALRTFLSPLSILEQGSFLQEILGENWEGWPFGRHLYLSEIHSLLQQVPGVRYVSDIRVEQRRVLPVREQPVTDDLTLVRSEIDLGPLRSVDQILPILADGLLCSLDHQIHVVDPLSPPPARLTTASRSTDTNGAANGNGASQQQQRAQ